MIKKTKKDSCRYACKLPYDGPFPLCRMILSVVRFAWSIVFGAYINVNKGISIGQVIMVSQAYLYAELFCSFHQQRYAVVSITFTGGIYIGSHPCHMGAGGGCTIAGSV